MNALLYGTNGEKIEMHRTNEFGSGVYYNTFEGIVENLERRFRETNSEWMKEEIGSFMSGVECPDCHGKRLKPVVLAVTVGDKNISEFCEMSIRDELKFIAENEPNLTRSERQIGGQIMKEIRNRLQFLQSVGLDYLTWPARWHPVRRREPAHPSGDPDRQCADRRALRARRAEHRPAPA